MDTRQKITQTAFIIFLEKGYKSTTYAELIAAVGVSKGAFYHYFKNKEELFFEVIDNYFLSFFTQVDWSDFENLKAEDLEPRIKSFYSSFIEQINQLTNKGLSRYFILFFEALELHPTFREQVQGIYLQFKKLAESKLKGSNTQMSGLDLISKYEGYVFWLAIFPDEKIENLTK